MIFDAKGKTFRDDLYADYKAHRPSMPEELRQQIEPINQIITAMGLPLLRIEGVEADDVIATLACAAKDGGQHTLISTGDKDLAQLVCSHITLINTMTDTLLNEDAVVEKFGVRPDQIVDYLTLLGDSADNIPGVPKVGKKTAEKWLQQYQSLDELLKHSDQVKGKVGENLREHQQQLPFFRQLIEVKKEVDGVSLTQLIPSPIDAAALLEHYQHFEFKTWASELMNSSEPVTTTRTKDYQTITTLGELNNLIDQLMQADVFAFDTETTSLCVQDAQLVGISFSLQANQAYYIPFSHDYLGAPEQLDLATVLARLSPVFTNTKIIKVAQNLKYDLSILASYDITLAEPLQDTMLMSYTLNSTTNRHDLDTLALKYLDIKPVSFETIAGKGKSQLTFNQVALDIATDYAAEDADITLQLYHLFTEKLSATPQILNVLNTLDIPLVKLLSQMERHGVLINQQKLLQQSGQLAKRLTQLEEEAYILADEHFNLASPKQLQHILFEKQQLPIQQKTPKGQPSTAEHVLQALAFDYPLPKLILEHRSLSKLKSTYTDKLPQQVHATTGRVHTSYNQAVTTTGRPVFIKS